MSQQLVEVIKQIAVKAVESQKPTIIQYGTVVSLSPFQVRISQKEIYGKGILITLDGLPDFQIGEELILLRLQGGQQYLILGKKGEIP